MATVQPRSFTTVSAIWNAKNLVSRSREPRVEDGCYKTIKVDTGSGAGSRLLTVNFREAIGTVPLRRRRPRRQPTWDGMEGKLTQLRSVLWDAGRSEKADNGWCGTRHGF
jgi:hypothetical protein